jgi:hypothetical protein
MRSFCRLFLISATLGLVLSTAFLGITSQRAAAQLPSADLALLRMSGPHQAKSGKVVTIKIVATNLGPATSQLDVAVTSAQGLELDVLQCDLGISADGPFCEYSNVAPGAKRTTLALATVLSGAGSSGTLTACTGNEGQTVDLNSNNDCQTLSVVITGG